LVIDGAVNGELFVACVEPVLVPTLQAGDVVVLDKLSSHKGVAVREAIAQACCPRWDRPPHGLDLNPIAWAFRKLKALQHREGERTVEGLGKFLGQARDAFSPQQCRNYFRHGGYRAANATEIPKTD
jgi:transposase